MIGRIDTDTLKRMVADEEIETMAEASDESPRKVRARVERENMMEALMTQALERKTLEFVLSTAEYEDVPLDAKPAASVSSVEGSASGMSEEELPAMETAEGEEEEEQRRKGEEEKE